MDKQSQRSEIKSFEKVLIVEDDLSQKPLWKQVISRFSDTAQIEWVVSSEQAKKLIQQSGAAPRPYDLVIVDLFLAGSDTGLDFLKSDEVRRLGAKTILVSAADQASLESSLPSELGKTKVITKPLNVGKCENALKALIN